ncbi:MAG: ATP-grasp domain-containing protein, partial [Bacteroidota bacterium]|nr:ATP-grasp domain-containing protein [Bacteroidota bacterium]
LGLCLNKARVKEILSYYGIPTPRSVLIRKLPLENGEHHLDFPLIVKPSFEDASLGIDNKSVVYSWNELEQRVKFVLEEFNQPCLVEEYIEGREINVAILGNAEPAALPLSEIDFSSLPEGYPHIVSYNSKWIKGSIEFDCTIPVCPAPLEKITEKKVKEFALRAYKILGLRDYARVDIRLDRNGKPFVIEVNPNPDLSDDAGFARSGSVAGMDYHTLVQKIVEIALERNNK